MNRYAAILFTVVLCMCISACTNQPWETQYEETASQSAQTTVPVLDDASTTPENSIPLGETVESLTPAEDVITPNGMPDKPEADYTIPPQPGQTGSY